MLLSRNAIVAFCLGNSFVFYGNHSLFIDSEKYRNEHLYIIGKSMTCQYIILEVAGVENDFATIIFLSLVCCSRHFLSIDFFNPLQFPGFIPLFSVMGK